MIGVVQDQVVEMVVGAAEKGNRDGVEAVGAAAGIFVERARVRSVTGAVTQFRGRTRLSAHERMADFV